jgi:predicted nucleic-acid-binding Zn-ribbon protein
MSSFDIEKKHLMMVKCWNCHTEFEHVSSARDSSKHTVESIAAVLRSNIFDASRGTVLVNVDDLIDEIAEVIVDNV